MSEPVAPYRVLIVDDDPDMGAYLGLLLKKEGMQADIVENGDAALMRVMTDPPDLLLLDVMMPGRSGFEICQRLKSEEATALIPIVLITGLDDQKSRIHGIEAGADDFLNKPVKREELVARVKTLRRLHDTRKELEGRRLAAEVERKEAIRKTFSRYISPRLADRIMSDADKPGEIFSKAQRSNVVALFADLRGFTSLTDRTEVGRVVEMLNQYFSILSEAAYRHDATIFNMAGDALLVGFNVPFPQADPAARAWRCAQEMLTQFAPVADQWEKEQGLGTGVGIGICMGEAVIGNVGSPHYMSYTIIGNPVNSAARLMQLAQPYEILICDKVYDELREIVPPEHVESRGDVTLRGRAEPIKVYSVKIPLPQSDAGRT
ncbi:MAG: adenylate/guanylate cyclase domain-containing response regulator [Betaproteobacteria bacterium]|nr:adenylate/guanylate cyclase domain-containing response regulator [Betaproteobacteria bacterium]